MKVIRIYVLGISALFLFASCQTTVVGGGGATETVNCQVLSSGGIPDSGALVRLIDADNWFEKRRRGESVVFDSAITGSNGHFTLRYPRGLMTNLQIDGEHEALFVKHFISRQQSGDTSTTLRLKPTATLSGSIDGEVDHIELYGSSYSLAVLDGNFSHAVADGLYPLFLRSDDKITFHSAVNLLSSSPESINLEQRPSVLLIEDFAEPFELYTPSKLGLITGGHWYCYNDPEPGNQDTSIINVSVSKMGAYEGSSLSAVAVLGAGLEYPYAGIGVTIGENGRPYDLSGVHTFSFVARGNCMIYFSVETSLIDSLEQNIHFGKLVALTDAWTFYSIPVTELTIPTGSKADQLGITWESATYSVARIEFDLPPGSNATGDTLRFQIDNVYMHGVSIEDLLK